MPRIFNPATHNVSSTEYILRNTSPLMVVAMFVILLVWTLQELQLRDAYPVEQFKKANHVMDILEVVCGAMVTGYIFHLVVDHIPAKHKEYDNRVAIEKELTGFLHSYTSTMRDLLKQRVRTGDEMHIFKLKSTDWERLAQIVSNSGDRTAYQPLNHPIRLSKLFCSRMVDEVGSHRYNTDRRLNHALKQVRKRLAMFEKINISQQHDLSRAKTISDCTTMIFNYLEEEVLARRHCLSDTYQVVTFHGLNHLWDDIESRQVRFIVRQ